MNTDIQNPGSALGEAIGAEMEKVYEFASIEKAVTFLNTAELKRVFIIGDSLTLFDPPPMFKE